MKQSRLGVEFEKIPRNLFADILGMIAELRPPSQPLGISGAALRELMDGLPPLDEDFASEVELERARLGTETGAWPES